MKNEMYHRNAPEYGRANAQNIFNAEFERPTLLSLAPPLEGKYVFDAGCGRMHKPH